MQSILFYQSHHQVGQQNGTEKTHRQQQLKLDKVELIKVS